MHPIMLSLGSITVYTYGFFIAVGFLTAFYYISYSLKKSNNKIISQEDLYSLFLYAIIAAIVGARLLYVLVNIKDFIAAPLSVFKVWQGGLVYYGGFIAAAAFIIFYAKKKKIPLGKLSDIVAPALALGHLFGRIGCFFAGCCYGKTCDLPWAVVFTDAHSLAVKGIAVHPTQLYEAFGNLVIFAVLYFYNRKNHAAGKTFALYLVFYAVLRFSIEFFRGDFRGAVFAGLSISQTVSIFLLFSGLFIIYRADKHGK